MKNTLQFLLVIGSLFMHYAGFAQLSEGGLPYTFYNNSTLKAAANLPHYDMGELAVASFIAEDSLNPEPLRYMVFTEAIIDLKAESTLADLSDKDGKLYQYKVKGGNAKALQLVFSRFCLPEGASLYIYNSDYSMIYGAFTAKNNRADSTFRIADFPGSELIIEYFEPNNAAFSGLLEVAKIGQAYRSMSGDDSSLDEDGYVSINCPEGQDWQNEKHGVCRITYEQGRYSYLCTGALINNVNNDGTPYFLTANHCVSGDLVAQTVVAYFNYEQSGCNTDDLTGYKTLSGASLKTTGENSDYTLLLFDETPDESYQPYYAGWNISETPATQTTGIHHPAGEPKKISLAYDASISYAYPVTWDNDVVTPANTHWLLSFDLGETAGGSSGSPSYNEHHQIVGQLHGGGSDFDLYGKLVYSWTNPDAGYSTLQSFLDPDETDVDSIGSYYPAGNVPDPKIYCDYDVVCTDAAVPFYGVSAFEPSAWEWSFSPATVTYEEGTSSSSQNPLVSFQEATTYEVFLTATNAGGEGDSNQDSYVTAGSSIEVSVEAYELEDSCLCSLDSVVFKGYGSTKYKWILDDVTANYYTVVNDTVNPVVLKKIDGTVYPDVALTFEGSMGTCMESLDYNFELIYQENDSAKNATTLVLGDNGTFTNKCATVEEGEPYPPLRSCTGQTTWCDEYGTGTDVLDNSIWFYFEPDADATYKLTSDGMDNQIAIYEADHYSDLLTTQYSLIAANDDYSSLNYNAVINSFSVEAGKTYWIQVDGSGGGTEGSFTLNLQAANAVKGETLSAANLKLYPQPVSQSLNISCSALANSESAEVLIYNLSGKNVSAQNLELNGSEQVAVDVASLPQGLYLLQLICDQEVFSTKMIKE